MTHTHTLMMGLATLAAAPLVAAQDAPANAEQQKAPASIDAPAAMSQEKIKQAFSFLMGYRLGRDISMETTAVTVDDFDREAFFKAVAMGLAGERPGVNTEEMDQAMESFVQQLQQRDQKKGEANAAAGKAFLENNAKQPGVVTTKSGLQYKVLTEGKGRKYDAAKDGKAVASVTYGGRLIDGLVFDQTASPVDMPIDRVVPGFSEALKMMPIGSEWEIYIPSELAYGEQGPAPIGRNSTLIFKLSLKDIKPAAGTAGNPIELTPEIEAQLRAQGLEPIGGKVEERPAPAQK